MERLAILLAVAVFGLGFIAWTVLEVGRIARAVGALVIQETGKLRN